jgi:murein L,D-transpeptidase YcbB/YkuD
VSSVKGVGIEALRPAMVRRLAAPPPEPIDADGWRHVRGLYAAYGGSALWLDAGGVQRDRGAALVTALVDATTDGLRLDRYPLDRMARALDSLRATRAPTADQLADLDVLLTAAFVALGEDLLRGQVNPKTVTKDWHIDPREDRVDSALVRVIRTDPLDRAIAMMRPQDPNYQALREELVRYRPIAARGWTNVPRGGTLKPGQTERASRLAALRQRLREEGIELDTLVADSASSASPARATYDSTLAAAVAQFQSLHGIPSDSVLGPGTIAVMNVAASYRLGQIAANLERYRWMPRELGSRYILVNVPAFTLQAFDDGREALTMKVVVGADYEDRKTPVFSDTLETVVFRPYWNVTDDIARREIWPKANADPSYLRRNGYETYREGGSTHIRQVPGPENALGQVKFLFPNQYDIYLHDTPHTELFEKSVRAFSHGCIRLEKPGALAEWVLGWPADSVQRAMQQPPDDKSVPAPAGIAVYIAYFTTIVRDGRVDFGNDLYGRDDALITAVAPGAVPSAEAIRSVEALRAAMPG